jgi:hypothetical protein
MRKMLFHEPVCIKSATDSDGHDIDCVETALHFLRNWPAARRGPVYQAAFNACTAAKEGYLTIEEARSSLAGFARITGILQHVAQRAPSPAGDQPLARRASH